MSEYAVSPPQNIRVKGANGRALRILGNVPYEVRVAAGVTKLPCLVFDSSPVDIFLGTQFIGRLVRDIHVEYNSIDLKDGTKDSYFSRPSAYGQLKSR